jgi:hypothetical protein
VLVFAASTFGLLATLLDWAIVRPLLPRRLTKPEREHLQQQQVVSTPPPPAQAPQSDPIIGKARRRPIVFREICPPASSTGLSFYGGVPIGPQALEWPRSPKVGTPLSFVMQWDCSELSSQDVTGLLPRDGALYLFSDLTWGDPFDFRFVHAPGPVHTWQALAAPPGLLPIFGKNGAYQVPYCSPQMPPENQDLPTFLPKWPFAPKALSLPFAPTQDQAGWFWSEGDAVSEALLGLEHPEGVPPAGPLREPQASFERPFPAFPHDYAAVRVIAAKVLDKLRWPTKSLLRELSEQEREDAFQRWRDEASRHYTAAAEHHPADRVEQSLADDMWRWMAGLEPVLRPGWGRLVDETVNVSLGLSTQAVDAIPAGLVAACAGHHRLASAYIHEEYADWGKPEALEAWKKRKAEGSLQIVRKVHAPCPNHMFGPPSYVQGYVEEHLERCVLLLELSSRQPIGHEFGEGVLQFMIEPADLRERRFDKTILIASAY